MRGRSSPELRRTPRKVLHHRSEAFASGELDRDDDVGDESPHRVQCGQRLGSTSPSFLFQEEEGQGGQHEVAVEARVPTAFEVVERQLTLELLIVEVDFRTS